MAGSPATEVPEGDLPFIPDIIKQHVGEFVWDKGSTWWWEAKTVTPAGNDLLVAVAGPKNQAWANRWIIWEFEPGYFAKQEGIGFPSHVDALRTWGDHKAFATEPGLQPFDAMMVVVAIFTEEGNATSPTE